MMSQSVPDEISFERERAILEEIRENPEQHHNALIKSLVPKYMAKTTFEKTRDRLIEKNVLEVVKKGNKKIYKIIQNHQKKSQQLLERITLENYHFLQNQIKRSKENYHHKDVNEKITNSIKLLKGLLQTDNGFTILDSVKDSKKTLYKDEHQMIQQMISKIFEMISNEQDYELIYPIVMDKIEKNLLVNRFSTY
jgi:predicted transcriptional regulator